MTNPNTLDDAVYSKFSERRFRKKSQRLVRLAKSRLPKVMKLRDLPRVKLK